MKKTFNYFLAIVALAGFFSCSKTSVPEGQVSGASQTEQASDVPETEQPSDVPQGYVKLYFDADMPTDEEMPLEQTKMAMSGLSVVWQGTETIRIWYKDDEDAVQYTAATFESYSGKKAILSAVIPETAPKDVFIAELNGVSDGVSGSKRPFGTDSARPRVKVSSDQTATLGSFDPSAYAMGARWVGTSGDKPSFQFKNLTNLLKITVDNNTGKTLQKIVLSNDASIASANYWTIDDAGSPAVAGSTVGSTSITLSGRDITDGDYYFVLSAKNNSGNITLSNMEVAFYFDDHTIRTFSNPNSLTMSGYSKEAFLGTFPIETADLSYDESTFAPFGTRWTSSFIAAWAPAYSPYLYYEAPAAVVPVGRTETPIGYIEAHKSDGSGSNISTSYYYVQGLFTFEFFAADEGTGTLTFTVRATDGTTSEGKFIRVIVKRGKTVIFTSDKIWDYNEPTAVSLDLTVKKGDLITIQHRGGTNNGRLYFNETDRALSWMQKVAE